MNSDQARAIIALNNIDIAANITALQTMLDSCSEAAQIKYSCIRMLCNYNDLLNTFVR